MEGLSPKNQKVNSTQKNYNAMQWSGKNNDFLTMWRETVFNADWYISVMLKRDFGGNTSI